MSNELQDLIVVASGIVLAGLVGAILSWLLGWSRAKWIAFFARISPDQFDDLAKLFACMAYDALEQLSEKYGKLTNDEKQEQAIAWITEGIQYATGKKPSEELVKMALEAFIRRRKAESVPLPETVTDQG